jgi:hypothetical protein
VSDIHAMRIIFWIASPLKGDNSPLTFLNHFCMVQKCFVLLVLIVFILFLLFLNWFSVSFVRIYSFLSIIFYLFISARGGPVVQLQPRDREVVSSNLTRASRAKHKTIVIVSLLV